MQWMQLRDVDGWTAAAAIARDAGDAATPSYQLLASSASTRASRGQTVRQGPAVRRGQRLEQLD